MPTLQEIKERRQKSRLERQQKQQETELQIVNSPQTKQGQGNTKLVQLILWILFSSEI